MDEQASARGYGDTRRRVQEVMRTAVDAGGRELEADDVAFAALPDQDGMRVSLATGVRDPRFEQMLVRPGRGLGGQVLDSNRAAAVADYAHDSRITRDFIEVVSLGEGLRGVVCVPVGPLRGIPSALLYAARRAAGSFEDRAIDRMTTIAAFAEVGLAGARDRARELALQRIHDRQRLAVELHDTVAQALFVIGVAASGAQHDEEASKIRDALQLIDRTATGARWRLRDTLQRLDDCPSALAFDARLEAELRLVERQYGCNARVVRAGTVEDLPEAVDELALDVAVEGLRNAVKHEAATHGLVFVDADPGELRVTVQAEQRAKATRLVVEGQAAGTGCGLELLGDRARRLRGELELDRDEDGHRILRLRLPLTTRGAE